MSSRQEEKERRRAEREERQQAEASKAATRRRLQLAAGGVLAMAAVAAVIAALAAGSGDGDGDASGEAAYGTAAIPARKTTDFDAAVNAAGCVYKNEPNEGSTHLASDTATNVKYKTNPPTSGNHRPTPAHDGVYPPGNSPEPYNYVHTLEHGRIEYQYSVTAPKRLRDQLNTLVNEPFRGVEGYHQLLFENNTDMPYEVAATAWTQLLGCKTVNAKTWDALRAFRDRFVDKAPEKIP